MFAPAPPAEQFGLPRETPAFNLLDVALVIIGGFVILVVVQAVALAVAKMLPQFAALTILQLAKLPLVIIPAQVVSYIFLIGFVHILMLSRHGISLTQAIPFRWPSGTAAALLAAGVGLALAIQFLGRFLPMPKQLPIDEYFKERSAAFVMLAFGVFIAPVVEELLFRGLLYPVLTASIGKLFAAPQASVVGLALILAIGASLILAQTRGRTYGFILFGCALVAVWLILVSATAQLERVYPFAVFFGVSLAGLISYRFFSGIVLTTTSLLAVLLGVCLLFRSRLETRASALGTVFALVSTSYLFALLHGSQLAFSWAPLLSLFLVGLALTLVRARYRSVMASTLMHMSYNATLFTFLLVVTRGFRHMEVLAR